jgi:hypothetical protein
MINIIGALFVVVITAITGLSSYFPNLIKTSSTPQAIATITPTPTIKPIIKTIKKQEVVEKKTLNTSTPSNKNINSCIVVTIPCYYSNKLSSASGCTSSEAETACKRYQESTSNLNNCIAESNTLYNSCKQPCDNNYQSGRLICEIAYTGQNATINQDVSKYGECINEVVQIWNQCSDMCLNAKIAKKCS